MNQNIPNKYLPWNIKRKRIWLAWSILLAGVLITWSISVYVKREIEFRAKQEFDFVANEIKNKIVTRLFAHAQLLRSGSAYIEGSIIVTREEWRDYIDHQNIEKTLLGIQGIGYSVIIPPEQLRQHEQKIRQEGFPQYSVKPSGKRDLYTSIIYLEPFSGRSLRAFGYDMYSEPIRRSAMEFARDHNTAALSGKITLVQETEKDVQPGTLMYVPVYDLNMAVGSIDERRKAIRGWVFSPYRMNDLMEGILGGYAHDDSKQFQIKIFDGASFDPNDLLYSSGNDTGHSSPIFSTQTSFAFANRVWHMQLVQNENLISRIDSTQLWGTAVGGIVISVLLFILYLVLINTNHRAFSLSEKLLNDIRTTEEQFKNMFDMNNAVMLLIEPRSGNIIDANAAAVQFYGYAKEKICSMNIAEINLLEEKEVAALQKNADGKEQKYFHFPHKLANGEIRTVEDHSSLMVLQEKNLLFSIIHDISDRIQAEKLLQQTHQNYETFFNTVDDFLFVLDEKGNIIHVNSCVTNRLGYTEEELINVSVLMVHPAERREEAGRIVGEMLAGKAEVCPVPLITKAGEQIPVETRVKPGIWNNRPVIFGVTKDISRLTLSEEKFSKLFYLNPSAAGLSDLQTHHYIEVNDQFSALLGFQKDEVVGKTAMELGILAEDNRILVEQTADTNGKISNVVTTLRAKNGEIKHVLISAENIFVQHKKYRLTIAHDITLLKQAEEELKESEQKHRRLFETMSQGVVYYDSNGKIVSVNPAASRILGIPVDQFEKKSFFNSEWKIIRDDGSELPQKEHPISVVMNTGKTIERFVIGIFNPNLQTHLWLSITAIPLFHPDEEKPFQIYSTFENITQTRLVLNSLRENESILKALFNSTDESRFLLSRDGTVLSINDIAVKRMGIPREEIIGKNAFDLMPPEVEKKRRPFFQQVLSTGLPVTFEDVLFSGWKLNHMHPVFDTTEKIDRIAVSSRDISDRKRSEMDLKEAQSISHIGSWKWDLKTNEVIWSDEMYRIFGIGKESYSGRLGDVIAKVIHPDDLYIVLPENANRFARNKPNEYRIILPDKSIRNIMARAGDIQLDNEGNPIFICGTAQDITEQKHADEALRQAQKLEGIGTLAGGIAHDFNNLLVGILGQSELALKKLPKESPAISNIVKMITASERAADLTKQLLAYSGKGKFFTVEIDLNKMVLDNGELLAVSVPKNAQLRYDLSPVMPRIMGDVGQIQQVVMNLIINAGEALGSDQGFISLRTRIISLSQNDTKYDKYTNTSLVEGNYVLLEVSDTGCGISEESLSRIFDPFYTTKFTGRGLGLAAVLGIIRGHKGGLRIESLLGKGTTFEVILPLIENGAAFENDTTKEINSGNNKSKTILVIDDDPTVISLLHDTLTFAEYNIISSHDPLEGIELYRKHQHEICLVILDYSMPVMNGRAVFEELLKINGGVKVVLSSGYTEEATLSTFGTVRPIGFFQKPYKLQTILDKISQIITG